MDASTARSANNRLRHERLRRNWRQQDLADQVGTTIVTVRRWEQGSHQPSAYFRVKLCAVFGKSAEELGLIDGTTTPSLPQKDAPATKPTRLPLAEPPALWTVPYLRNPHFTGREDLLKQLVQHLSLEKRNATTTRRAVLSQPQAVKGLGGIGKTQIALEYAYRARAQDSHTHILWINAASEEAIITSFLTLAEQLPSFPDKDEKDQHQLIAAIKRWLDQCQEPWLLILDNADDLSLVQHYIPQQGQGSILLTTRATAVAWLANAVDVDQMGLVEGTQFLLHRTHRLSATDEEHNEACNVVIALDGFPLALDQAGAYIEETGCSFRGYLQLYEQHRTTLLARRGKQATNYPDSVATTWSLSFQKVEQAHPAAAELLRLCASLSPDHIPEELLTIGAPHWPPILQQAVADPLSFNELLEALLAFSLVKRLAQEHLLSLHRLVQAVQMDRMDSQEQRTWAVRVVCAVNTVFPADPKEEIETWPQCLRYLEQVQACETLIQRHHLQLPQAADLLNRAGVYLCEHASYNLAKPLFQQALAIAEPQVEREPLLVASSLNNLGVFYTEQGQYTQVEPLLMRALHIREQALGPHHPQVAYTLNNLGRLYKEQGKYEQAASHYQRSLDIREQALGPHHPLVASSLANLGGIYNMQGQYEQTEPFYQRALYIREKALGPHHPLVGSSLNNLGVLYYDQGKYDLAEPIWQRAFHIGEQTLGPHHPLAAIPLNNLGCLYFKQGKYKLAEPLLQRVLHTWEQALGSQHPQIAEPLNGLANISREQGRYEQANALYQRALSLRQEHLGPQHIEVAESLHDLARLRELQHQLTEARSLYQQALTIQEQVLGSYHPITIDTRERLDALLQHLRIREEGGSLEVARLKWAQRKDEQAPHEER